MMQHLVLKIHLRSIVLSSESRLNLLELISKTLFHEIVAGVDQKLL